MNYHAELEHLRAQMASARAAELNINRHYAQRRIARLQRHYADLQRQLDAMEARRPREVPQERGPSAFDVLRERARETLNTLSQWGAIVGRYF